MILTSVPKGMRAVLFDGKDAPFDRKDPRLRPVPFGVGKPVFEEVVAAHTRVTSIVFSDAANVAFDAPKPAKNTQKKSSVGREAQSVKAKAQEDVAGSGVAQQFDAEVCPPSIELIEACERGDLDAAVALLDRLDLNGGAAAAAAALEVDVAGNGSAALAGGAPATSWATGEVLNHPDGFERLMTPLHVAAAGGHAAVLGMLLQRGANPLAEDVRGRVPYLLASNRDTRDAFRRARAALPERWDWDAARVPEPLTEVRLRSARTRFALVFLSQFAPDCLVFSAVASKTLQAAECKLWREGSTKWLANGSCAVTFAEKMFVDDPLAQELEQRQKEKQKEKEKEKKRRAKQRKKAEKDKAEEEARQRKVWVC